MIEINMKTDHRAEIKPDCLTSMPTMDGGRIAELDGFRGAAVLAIVVLHYVIHHLQSTPGSPLAYTQKYLMFLWIGVDAFFVLSGFLIAGILIDQRETKNYFRVFYLRRSLRIFPLYYLLIVCWVVVTVTLTSVPGMRWLLEPGVSYWSYLVYGQNFMMAALASTGPNFVAATWSLAVEEHFYLALPMVVRWTRPAMLPHVLVIGVVLAPIFRLACAYLGPAWNEAQSVLLPSRCDSLLLGAFAAWAVRDSVSRDWLTRNRAGLFKLLGALGIFLGASPVLLANPHALHSPLLAFSVYTAIAAFFTTLLLLLQLRYLPIVARVLSGEILRYFGRISYTMYLFHTAILGLVFALLLGKEPILDGWTDWGAMLFAFCMTVVFAQLSWYFVEGRLISYGHRMRYAQCNHAN